MQKTNNIAQKELKLVDELIKLWRNAKSTKPKWFTVEKFIEMELWHRNQSRITPLITKLILLRLSEEMRHGELEPKELEVNINEL